MQTTIFNRICYVFLNNSHQIQCNVVKMAKEIPICATASIVITKNYTPQLYTCRFIITRRYPIYTNIYSMYIYII